MAIKTYGKSRLEIVGLNTVVLGVLVLLVVGGYKACDAIHTMREHTYIVDTYKKTFHLPGCPYLPAERSQNRFDHYTRKSMIDYFGYDPCPVCKP